MRASYSAAFASASAASLLSLEGAFFLMPMRRRLDLEWLLEPNIQGPLPGRALRELEKAAP